MKMNLIVNKEELDYEKWKKYLVKLSSNIYGIPPYYLKTPEENETLEELIIVEGTENTIIVSQ